MMRWPWGKDRPGVRPFVAKMPDQDLTTGAKLNIHDATWLFMQRYCKDTLQDLRENNDSPILASTDTAYLRGRIRALKDILELPAELEKPKPFKSQPIHETEDLY